MSSNWSLKEEDKELPPLKFSNGSTQEDIVNQILKEIKNHKIIFIRGKCGTGKSAIALNVAKELGKTSVVVPIKTLQKQYEYDYSSKKQIVKNGKKLRIDVIRGRANFKCPFISKQEKQATLSENSSQLKNNCDYFLLPCKIEIKEKNKKKVKEYLRKNEDVNSNLPLSRVRRLSIAPICPYWSPIVPSEIDLSVLNANKKKYRALNNKEYTIYKRKPGCGYYDQYSAYIDSDVIIFNSQKYKLETLMDRKPETELEIIDECDEFLDSLSNQKTININRLNMALGFLFAYDQDNKKVVDKLIKITSKIASKKNPDSEKIFPLKDTRMYELLRLFLDSDIMGNVDCDEENYSYNAEEAALTFQDFFNETYVSFSREGRDLIARLVTTNIEKRFKKILNKNKSFILMSGTIHSEKVLKEIFGLEDFKIIDAETETPGTITPVKTGREINCSYRNFKQEKHSRKDYLTALQTSIEKAPKPALVHITSFYDLPSEEEIKDLNLNIISRGKLKKLQRDSEKLVRRFKQGKIKVLYTTKCNRGVDFPGDICKSIILTKFPFPNVKSLFWRILKRTHPEHYNDFYLDKARRELLQKIYRGLRYESDHIFLLSPDSRVFNRFRLDL